MQKSILIALTILGIATIGLFNMRANTQSSEQMFKLWQQNNNKHYADAAEHYYRFKIWLSNLQYVNSHNARYYAGLQTYQLQMNLFADLQSQQFGAKFLGYNKDIQVTNKCTGKQASTTNLPNQVDWASKGAVTPIKNQGQCGSCWAFSTTGSLEGAKFIATQKLSSYSEQQLVDCSGSYGNKGCSGGLMDMAFYYVKDNGITLQDSYPYKGVGGTCHYNASSDKAWTISDCTDVQVNKELPLKAAIAQQPVSVAIQANHLSFQLYKKGVYSGQCGTNLDHGVLAVGYGTLDTKNYWKVKNSWGATWGSNGYILILRNGDGKGQCGIQEAASFPIA